MTNGQGTVMDNCAEFSSPEHQDSEARSNMYRFLASVYLQPPSQQLVQSITDETFLDELSELFGEDAVAELKNYASNIDIDEEVSVLKQEYMDLFAVPTGRYVTPFEDVYRGIRQDGSQEPGPLLGDRAIAAKILYRAAGVQLDQACKELPTHIGVELAFMEFLCNREAAAINHESEENLSDEEQDEAKPDIYRQYQIKFLDEHLTEWFPQLSRAIQVKTRSSFYRGLAQLTEKYLTMEMASLVTDMHLANKVQAPEHATNT